PLEKVHFCHCRMCQRAMGNVFAALAGVPKEALEWTRGTPSFFASSSHAKRIYVTIGSLDHPEAAVPIIQYGVESQLPWLEVNAHLPREETGKTDALAQMTVFQFGGSATHG